MTVSAEARPTRAQRARAERRQNLLALLIGSAAFVLIAAFAWRPAVVPPVGTEALENSLRGPSAVPDSIRRDPSCESADGGGFRCVITRYPTTEDYFGY